MVQQNHEGPRILLSTVKRNVLVGKICAFCVVLSVCHMFLDGSQGLYQSVAVDLLFALIIGFAWLLNNWGAHLASKIFVLLSLNVLFVFFATVVPKDVGTYLYYFPLIVASSALFDSHEKVFRYCFVAMPLILLGVLFLFDFDVFHGFRFEAPENVRVFFVVNAFSSAAITIICVNFMQKLNTSSERELLQLAEEVKAKNLHLEKTNVELDRFLYSTSHDLRSPLSSIKGLVNIAKLETNDSKIQQYFAMMIDRVEKLDLFISDIIDYSKNARTDVQFEPVDIAALLTDIIDNLKYIEGAESIHFEQEVHVDSPIPADRGRLNIVLNNLLANAIKYHDPAKERQWIRVQVGRSEDSVRLTVADNGMGIDAEHEAKIFQMFYRGTFRSKGSGLGLYIVKEAVERMGGTIALDSKPGEGSSFTVTFPVLLPDTGYKPAHLLRPQAVSASSAAFAGGRTSTPIAGR